jgi:hypothetical protein
MSPSLQTYVHTRNSLFGSAIFNPGALVRRYFVSWNVSSHSDVQTNLTQFFLSEVTGKPILEFFFMNLL